MLSEGRDLALRLTQARDPDDGERATISSLQARLLRRMFRTAAGSGQEVDGGRIGRYVLLEPIGTGGLGVVHAAYDPGLDRKVAIKRLRPRIPSGLSIAEVGLQLIGEARALARLSHPNIVALFDAGLHEGEPFVVMELVPGIDGARWLREAAAGRRRRSWREVIRVFVEAGQGLAAAHQVGIVHGDFKPGNVLLGHDGRTRVIDFGLARFIASESVTQPGDGEDSSPLAIVGTPSYLAPERHYGAPTDARTDLYAYCVSLFEALHGARPFSGAPVDLLASKQRGAPKPSRALPSALGRILEKGLAPDPRDRFETVAEVVAALERIAYRRKRSVGAALAGLAVWAAVGIAGADASRTPAATCADDAAQQRGRWGGTERRDVAASFTKVPAPLAQQSWSRFDAGMQRRVDALAALTEAQCRLAPEGAWAEHPTRACLEGSGLETANLVDLLRDGDASTTHNAVLALEALTPPSDCVASSAQARWQDQVSPELRTMITRGRALAAAGQFREAALTVAEALSHPEVEGAPAVRAELLMSHAEAQAELGDHAQAEATLVEVARHSALTGDLEHAVRAASGLALVLAVGASHPRDATRWADRAKQLMAHNTFDESRVAHLVNNAATIALEAGDYATARREFDRARQMFERIYGPEHTAVAMARANVGAALSMEGDYAEAEAELARARAHYERVLGPAHPRVAGVLGNLGQVFVLQGELDRAHEVLTEALAVAEGALGPESPHLARFHGRLGQVDMKRGNHDAAERRLRTAIALLEREDPGHQHLIVHRGNLAVVMGFRGRHAEAEEELLRLVGLLEARYGYAHPYAAQTYANIAAARTHMGRLEAALEAYDRALAVVDDLPVRIEWQLRRAELLVKENRPGAYEAVRELIDRSPPLDDPAQLARARFIGARALWPTRPEQAHQLAQMARATLRDRDLLGAELLSQIERWLSAHPLRRGRR